MDAFWNPSFFYSCREHGTCRISSSVKFLIFTTSTIRIVSIFSFSVNDYTYGSMVVENIWRVFTNREGILTQFHKYFDWLLRSLLEVPRTENASRETVLCVLLLFSSSYPSVYQLTLYQCLWPFCNVNLQIWPSSFKQYFLFFFLFFLASAFNLLNHLVEGREIWCHTENTFHLMLQGSIFKIYNSSSLLPY